MVNTLRKHWFLPALALVIMFTFLLPAAAGKTASLIHIPTQVFIVMFLMSFTLETHAILRTLKRPFPLALGTSLSYIAVPLIAYGCAALFLTSSRDYRMGLIIMAAMPCTLASATIWTRMAGGNEALSLFVTLVTNALTFLVTPFILYLALGTGVTIPFKVMVVRLLLVVILPVTLGQVSRYPLTCRKWSVTFKPVISKICQVLILSLILKGSASAVHPLLQSIRNGGSMQVFLLAAAIIVTHTVSLGAAYATAKTGKLKAGDRTSLIFAGSQKTLPEALYVAGTFFPGYPLANIPLILFHAFQLIIDSIVAEKLGHQKNPEQ